MRSRFRFRSVLFVLSWAALAAFPVTSSAATLFVSPAGSGAAFSQASPGSLRDALLAANGGDTLYLAGGTYTDSGSWVAPINASVTLYGGWDGTTTFPVVRDPSAYPTILDGGGAHGVVGLGSGLTVTLDGLTIQNGLRPDSGGGISGSNVTLTLNNVTVTLNKADSEGYTSTFGGGLYLQGGSLVATHSTFSFNKSYCLACTFASGGGLYLDQVSSLDMEDCLVRGNDAWTGSGLDAEGPQGGGMDMDVTIRRTTFQDNGQRLSPGPSAVGYSGGAQVARATVILDQDRFLHNNAGSEAGALWLDWCGAQITRCFFQNNAAYEAGAIMFTTCADVQIVNNIITDNHSASGTQGSLYFSSTQGQIKQILHNTIANLSGPSQGNGITLVDVPGVTLRDNIIAGHAVGLNADAASAADMNATLWGGGAWANGADTGGAGVLTIGGINLHGDPLFVDAPGGDYHILAASPAVDAGVNAGVTVDIDGDTRPQRAGYDIGADEVPPCDVECTAAGPAPAFAGTPVGFTSTASPSNCISAPVYDWAFGDGTHSSLQNPTHTYDLPGDYNWTLDVMTDGVTCHRSGSATACGITCSAGASTATGYTPLDVTFTGGASATGGCTGPMTYDWNFGDGSAHSAEQSPTHTYGVAGNYVWILTVSAGGASCVKTGTLTVCTFSSSASASPTSGFYPLPVSFTGSATVAGSCANTSSIQWDFGDGTSGTGANPTHTYTQAGTYNWTMTAALGQLRNQQTTGMVTVCALTCGASASPASGVAPLLATFTGTASATGGCSLSPAFDWDFGDGSPHSQLQNPLHTYAAAGTYTWHVTVSGGGQACSQSGSLTVCSLSCSAQASASSGLEPLGVTFTAQGSLSGGCSIAVTYDWAFGDGTPHSSQQNVTHTFSSPGTYTWTLTVSSGGQTCTQTGTVTVCGVTCSASASPTTGFAPLAVNFTGAGSITGGCAGTVGYDWAFGDGSPHSSLQSPAHTYAAAGTYTWTLTVTAGSAACTQTGTVTACSLTCSASASPQSGIVPFAVVFSGNASSGACTSTAAYDWDFGDGTPHDSGAGPSHTYTSPGSYTWTMTVTEGGVSCTATGQVSAAPPCTLSCSASAQALGSVGLAVPFTGTATPSNCAGNTTYDWDFGDGSPHAAALSPTHTYNASGTYAWTFRAVAQGAVCTKSGTIVVVNPPVVGRLTTGSPFSIKVAGSNFIQGIQVFINGTAWPAVAWKKSTKLVIGGGKALKAAVPQGVTVAFRFVNPDGGEADVAWNR